MSNTRAAEWRFPERSQRPEVESPAPDNVSSQIQVPQKYPADHTTDDWCECSVCERDEFDI